MFLSRSAPTYPRSFRYAPDKSQSNVEAQISRSSMPNIEVDGHESVTKTNAPFRLPTPLKKQPTCPMFFSDFEISFAPSK